MGKKAQKLLNIEKAPVDHPQHSEIKQNIVGIDIGSVSITAVEMSPDRSIVQTAYRFHRGKIEQTLRAMLEDFGPFCRVAATSSTPSSIRANRRYNNQVAVLRAAAHYEARYHGILLVGGEKFGLIRFDDNGDYLDYKSNTSCAAGTGSFLDQQATRLGLVDAAELSSLALQNSASIPKIASRCAVFAKTDLVHAQQEGYSLPQICDGLCLGLAKNIVDTLFGSRLPTGPVLFTGGVANNQAVVGHIKALLQQNVDTCETHYQAIGAALALLDEAAADMDPLCTVQELVDTRPNDKGGYYPPLQLVLSKFPDFAGEHSYLFEQVEVDIYRPVSSGVLQVYLGFDVGSTSTKAVLLAESEVVAGFYTRTAGKPVIAMQSILQAIDDMAQQHQIELQFLGAATTGAGRKFVGQLMSADLILDEISAHARAAVELDPGVDTIIEIGGQDSKFTTLARGDVTFSTMNTVCAAGTGSFIEEQAQKLDCPLKDYSGRAENQQAPIASDRCTVFMERDINHYLSKGYTSDQMLASTLHSIVENYLSKVATAGGIGNVVLFQGATAKNRALVAAFEQRLGKPIHVSKYCHLTGALGSALSLQDQQPAATTFKGVRLHRNEIPISLERCALCNNQCTVTLAQVGGEQVAYGYLCGRDAGTDKFVDNNTSGFDLLKMRKKMWRPFAGKPDLELDESPTIGIPASLYLFEEVAFWRRFFANLSLKTVSSEPCREAVQTGKNMADAEFCAPIAALHGHVEYLLQRADHVFLPFYLEKRVEDKSCRRQYCYYSQFAPSLVAAAVSPEDKKKLLMPVENYLYSSFHDKVQLYRMLKTVLPKSRGFFDVVAAYDEAQQYHREKVELQRHLFQEKTQTDSPYVVLLGRPYTVLSPELNKRIPEIFGALGVQAFFQDMLSYDEQDVQDIAPLLEELHWNYASKILEAACVVAQKPGAYPVLITSFKCTPDTFVMDYFKRMMESYGKPYLILQLDEHDSSVGYETRIEAAIRSFANHHRGRSQVAGQTSPPALVPPLEQKLGDRTLLLPNWDDTTLQLTVAALQKEGVDARLLKRNATTQKGLRENTGQCIPLHMIAQDCMDYVQEHRLDPKKTVLWAVQSTIACNLALFPSHLKRIFEVSGGGMEEIGVYAGLLTFMDISVKLPFNIYWSYMFGGLLRKVGCKIRPYEKVAGQTDRVIAENISILRRAFLGRCSKEEALAEVVANFAAIPQQPGPKNRPKVAIFGDIYARDNEVLNQDLIHFIEANGGEVVVTSFHSYAKMLTKPYTQKWLREGLYFSALSSRTIMATLKRLEKQYYRIFMPLLQEPEPTYDESPEKILRSFAVRIENTGESIENLLKIYYAKKHHPDLSLFVQTSPAFCCPSLVTEAMAREIEKQVGVPIVSITYDGTGASKNDAIVPYLKYPRKVSGKGSERRLGSLAF